MQTFYVSLAILPRAFVPNTADHCCKIDTYRDTVGTKASCPLFKGVRHLEVHLFIGFMQI